MDIRTDLALETIGDVNTSQQGIETNIENIEGLGITTVKIKSNTAAEKYQKPKGDYVTIEGLKFSSVQQNFENEVRIIAHSIKKMLPKEGLVFIAGLGNTNITPDALGPICTENILATRHISKDILEATGLPELRQVSVLAPGVLGQTGIESAEIILSLCKSLKPGVVIVLDALASKSVERLGTTVQITNTGISPGSGVQNARKELSQKTLGVPVIAIGVPTVVDLNTIAYELSGGAQIKNNSCGNMMVTPKDIDSIIQRASKVLAIAVNKALQEKLSVEELIAITA